MRRRGPLGAGHWRAVAVAGAVAAVLPFVGAWASAEREPPATSPPRSAHPPAAEPVPDRPAATPERRPRPAAAAPPARARRAANRVALGAYIPGATERARRVKRFAKQIGRRPAILMYFRRMREARAFDLTTLRRVHHAGAVPLVTWEPWDQPLREIAAGRHDDFLRSEARGARRWGRLVLVRFAHEMNGDWYPWGVHVSPPRVYVRAWRRVVRIFRRQRARNVRFVWAPNADTGGTRLIRRFYPGDRWVDWLGFSGFCWGGAWDWLQPIDVYENTYRTLARIADKPIMIAETGAGEAGGDKARWIRRAFERDLPRLRRVKAVVWFDELDRLADFRVDSTRASLRAFRTAIASPRYGGTPADVKQGGLNR